MFIKFFYFVNTANQPPDVCHSLEEGEEGEWSGRLFCVRGIGQRQHGESQLESSDSRFRRACARLLEIEMGKMRKAETLAWVKEQLGKALVERLGAKPRSAWRASDKRLVRYIAGKGTIALGLFKRSLPKR